MIPQKIIKPDQDWKKELTSEQYTILREKGTEAAFTGKYWDSKEKGTFLCTGCGAALFSSNAKFDSGTGWPSFDHALPGAVEYREDAAHGMVRTEVVCAQCGGHLGHVFDDPPSSRMQDFGAAGGPHGSRTGKRYCINSACLNLRKE